MRRINVLITRWCERDEPRRSVRSHLTVLVCTQPPSLAKLDVPNMGLLFQLVSPEVCMTCLHPVSCTGTSAAVSLGFSCLFALMWRWESRSMMQKQQSRGTAHASCDSVSGEGSGKFCLLVSGGLLWRADPYLPGNAAACKKLPSKFTMVLWFTSRLSLMQRFANSCSLIDLAHSCSSQVEYLPTLGTRPS